MTAVIKCSRCRRRCRNMAGWNATFKDGRIVGYLCGDCQTVEENLEAQINEATIDYSKVRLVGEAS